jgi:uncharacterized membrane protein YphA (DoxX/SURF4 family)
MHSTTAPHPAPSTFGRLTRLPRLIATGVLALYFAYLYVTMGWPKFSPDSFWTGLFEHWGYPPSFRIIIGTVEVTAGVALLIPRFTTYAAMALIIVMVGAAGSLATDQRWGDVLTVCAYLTGLTWIAWEWRGHRLRGKPGR